MTELYHGKSVFGLTGGMGSGKSTVSTDLAERGVLIADADAIVKQNQEPGMPILAGMQEILGDDIVDADGVLIRKLAGERMFADPLKLEAINALIHGKVYDEINNIIWKANQDQLIVMDVPLLLDKGKPEGLLGIMVVDVTVDKAVERLMTFRGFSEAEARTRISAQMTRDERLSYADFVINNNFSRQHLKHEINRAYRWMQLRAELGKTAINGAAD